MKLPRTVKIINLIIGTRPDQPLCHGYGLTLLHRVEGNSPHWGEHWCATEHAFATICTHLHIFSIHYAQKQTKKHGKHIYITYKYICKALYMHICPAYMHIWQNILLHTAHTVYIYIYIYIYIYTQRKTLNNHVQDTDATGSSSQHSITIQWSPPEATIGFYQQTSP